MEANMAALENPHNYTLLEGAGRSPLPGELSKDMQTTRPSCGHADVQERSASLFRSILETRAAQQGSALAEDPVNQMLFSLELWGHQGCSTDEIKEKKCNKGFDERLCKLIVVCSTQQPCWCTTPFVKHSSMKQIIISSSFRLHTFLKYFHSKLF